MLAFTQFLEPILRLVAGFIEWLAPVGRFLPGAASDALVGSSIFTSLPGLRRGRRSARPGGRAGSCCSAYAAVITVLGWLTTWRRDIT